MNTPLRPPPMPIDAREEPVGDRKVLHTMAGQVAEMHAAVGQLGPLVLEHEARLQSHDRRLDDHGGRLVALEGGVKSQPRMPTRTRPREESLVDLEELEEITLGGTRKITGSREQIEAIAQARAQFHLAEMMDRRIADAARLARAEADAVPKRIVVAELVKHRNLALTAVIAVVLARADAIYQRFLALFTAHH